MFPLIRTALSRILPPEHLRWITFGHHEADECGAMNEWLAVASQAKVADRPRLAVDATVFVALSRS
jgi:flavorubredoxin